MCFGISLIKHELPEAIIDHYDLQRRLTTRGENCEPEYQFLFRDKLAQLPVIHAGQLQICEWGNRDNKNSRLPKTGWCRQESLEEGKWKWLKPELIEIPASYGLEKGVWFSITKAMQGVMVCDEQSQQHVYMLTQPASHYYNIMTRHHRMPILIGQQI